ncbi:CS1 type fimbrial major subunit [Pseudomonas sp. SM4]|jgi:hypothetical protein|uniref:CS1 type fimbrial major subunit n=1 Tax=Pseudomonas sp. SM4 TaxID=3424177 RepID=UPI003F7A216D
MNRRKIARVTLTGLLLACTCAHAAREVQEFEVSVSIPSSGFHVLPADPGWISREQRLPWSLLNSTLGGLRKDFDVKNEGGAIEAQLDGVAYLSSGESQHNINLQVVFNGRVLKVGEAVEVVSSVDAKQGRRVLLEITPQRPEDGVYKPGSYFGNVNMMFNAVLPGA